MEFLVYFAALAVLVFFIAPLLKRFDYVGYMKIENIPDSYGIFCFKTNHRSKTVYECYEWHYDFQKEMYVLMVHSGGFCHKYYIEIDDCLYITNYGALHENS